MQLHRRKDDLERAGARTLLVTFAAAEQARLWRGETGADFPMLLDRERAVYAAYGLERSVRRTWTLRTLRYYAEALLRGERGRRTGDDPHQLGGDFVVSAKGAEGTEGAEGILRLVHRSADPVDRPSVDEILDAVRKSRSPRASVRRRAR